MSASQVGPWKLFVRTAKKPVWYAVQRLTGRRLGLPVHYLDLAMMGGTFRLTRGRAAELVARDQFVPSVAQDGLARCQVTALEYRVVDILHPYNEVAVTIPGTFPGVRPEVDLHAYLHLPVTTEDARWPGVEIYGFPKYISAIGLQDADSQISMSWDLDGQPVLSLLVTKGEPKEDAWVVWNLTFLDGEPMLCTFSGHGGRFLSDAPGGATLDLGDHPIAQALRSAGIERASVSHFYCPKLRATLSAPVRLKDAARLAT